MYFSIVVLLMFVGLPLFEYTFFIVKLGEQESEKREEKRRERQKEKTCWPIHPGESLSPQRKLLMTCG